MSLEYECVCIYIHTCLGMSVALYSRIRLKILAAHHLIKNGLNFFKNNPICTMERISKGIWSFGGHRRLEVWFQRAIPKFGKFEVHFGKMKSNKLQFTKYNYTILLVNPALNFLFDFFGEFWAFNVQFQHRKVRFGFRLDQSSEISDSYSKIQTSSNSTSYGQEKFIYTLSKSSTVINDSTNGEPIMYMNIVLLSNSIQKTIYICMNELSL